MASRPGLTPPERTIGGLQLTPQNREELLAVTGLIEDGKLTPVVDRTCPLADTAEGLRHVEQGRARGRAVVIVA